MDNQNLFRLHQSILKIIQQFLGRIKSIMMNRTLIIVIFGITLACSSSNQKKEVDFEDFSIIIPSNWLKVSSNGIDSKVSFLITDKNDTIFINYGKNVGGFTETVRVHSLQSRVHFDSINWPYRHEMIFSKDATIEERQGIYLKEYYQYDTINGKRAKIKLPKMVGKGSTGIHFDSLNKSGEKLTIVGNNLNRETQDQLYLSLYSIIFEKVND